MDAEVGVIGLGIMGSMALWQLARDGVSVMGFEQFGIGHDYSAAGGESRIFRTAYGEGSEYVPIMLESYRLWRALEKESGNQILHLTGGLAIGDPDTLFMRNVLKSIERFELEHEILNREEAEKRYPQHPLNPGEMIVIDKKAGGLRPELAVVTAVKQAEKYGAKVESYTQVKSISLTSNGVQVEVAGNSFKFKKVIITTGPWTGSFLPDFKQLITVKRLAMGWFAARNINNFLPERFPVYIRESGESKFYGTPTFEGSMVKTAVFLKYGEYAHPDNVERQLTTEQLKELRDTVAKYLPGLYPDPVRVGVYMDGFTPDNHSIIGNIDSDNRIVLISGFSGHGFKMAPAIGRIAADLATDGQTDFEIGHLTPKRFQC